MKMKISTVILLVSLNSIVQFHTVISTCETNIVAKNVHNDGRKFHLKDSGSNKYIMVESSTMLIRTVSSIEFEHLIQNEVTWFTACNGFTPIDSNSKHFDICIAGTEEKRLFFDETFNIFIFLNQETSHTVLTNYMPMRMRLIQNIRTNSFEYAGLFCNRGYLQLENISIGINTGTLTMLSIEE